MLIVPFLTISDFRNVCYPGLLLLLFFFFLIIKKWKSERPNKILGPNLGFGGSKIGMSRQNRDTWQIWARIPVIIISILGNIVLSIFILVLRNFVGPTFRFFVLLAIKTRVLRVKKITTRQTQSGNPRKRGEFSCLNDIYYAPYC